MSELRDLIARASAYGLIITSDGSQLRDESVTGEPVRAAFRAELLARKAELLSYFGWREEATEIVCALMRRLDDCYPSGFGPDASEWRWADEAITEAYWSGDLAALREAVAEYERFARDRFSRARKGEER